MAHRDTFELFERDCMTGEHRCIMVGYRNECMTELARLMKRDSEDGKTVRIMTPNDVSSAQDEQSAPMFIWTLYVI